VAIPHGACILAQYVYNKTMGNDEIKMHILCIECDKDTDPDVSWEFITEMTPTAWTLVELHRKRYAHHVKVMPPKY
jgi:hypothetical protein